MNLLKNIEIISAAVADDELTRLRVEEELLTLLVKGKKGKMSTKIEAITKIKYINKKQLEILGEKVA